MLQSVITMKVDMVGYKVCFVYNKHTLHRLLNGIENNKPSKQYLLINKSIHLTVSINILYTCTTTT